MSENKRKQRVATPDEDKPSPAPRAALLPLVCLLARQAARECLRDIDHEIGTSAERSVRKEPGRG